MAKDKERSINPAQQQRKLEKAKQLKKSRAELQARRNEKLARRNPERIQRQIDDIKALEAAGDIKPRERAILQDLERDLKAIRKAREALGEKAPTYGGGHRRREGDGDNNVLGKRRHDGKRKHYQRRESSGSDTDDSVRRIPMPEDTPPPLPRESRRYFPRKEDETRAPQPDTALPPRPGPVPVVKTTYESAPQVRDLRKEAVNRFVPDVVRKMQQAAKVGPTGRLLEPEELDRLEAEGYLGRTDQKTQESVGIPEDQENARKLAEEEARFLRELEAQDQDTASQVDEDVRLEVGTVDRSDQRPSRHVEMEEVEDEDI
ncbi:hypothetical protein A1O7_03006 [Cladophialophora yegresii CBS 114405]|uniref:Wbp11/ELF5/Saf1 N-terminal domain-containing protein n=1 Tax=Cladophialophora yegresii CBS 114405 TaxID=1182544 RepID=W9W3P3_9EURO|nr:uncharacterized protein A1O7_03006 [Cladophialophora yegresii CBS 114405]EXJ62568.1 hypothetical protein A1O7_03006 [Cladophialophora yegresii CBS 114405]